MAIRIEAELNANTKQAQKEVEKLNLKVKEVGKSAKKSGQAISSDLGVTEVPYGNISFDVIQVLHGEQPTNDYSPPKITISNIVGQLPVGSILCIRKIYLECF